MAIYEALMLGVLVGIVFVWSVLTVVQMHDFVKLEKERLRVEKDKLELEEAKFFSYAFYDEGE